MGQTVRIAGRSYTSCGRDSGVAALLAAAGWILQRLPGEVVEHQRGALVEARKRSP
jgi:hypothetical protein